jgi:hypothetical protein
MIAYHPPAGSWRDLPKGIIAKALCPFAFCSKSYAQTPVADAQRQTGHEGKISPTHSKVNAVMEMAKVLQPKQAELVPQSMCELRQHHNRPTQSFIR